LVGLRAQGTYGVLYSAERTEAPGSGLVALKLALHSLDPRFEREAEMLSRIHHLNVPKLHERGTWNGPDGAPFPYLVMDWVQGLPLYSWARVHELTSRQVLLLLAHVARALAATHAAGGIHRDVKGNNILVREEDSRAVLTDFGSCTYRGASTLTHRLPPPGTPQYASPESQRFQWRWRRLVTARYEATPADDIYAMGVTAYRLVTQRYPLPETDSEEEVDDLHLPFPPLKPAEELVSITPQLARRIRQMLSEDPSARGTAEELALALEHAARTAGPEADLPILPRDARAPAASEVPPPPPLERQKPSWHRWFMAAAASVALAANLWVLVRVQAEQHPGTVAREDGAKDAGPTDLGSAALAARVGAGEPEHASGGISLDMPTEPLPGQRLRPCIYPEVEVNGGCWWSLSNASPPCSDRTYAWKDRCYSPSLGPPRPPTSEQK
jgi:serine/threonine protein kinase